MGKLSLSTAGNLEAFSRKPADAATMPTWRVVSTRLTRRCPLRVPRPPSGLQMADPSDSGHVRLVGAVAGVGSGTFILHFVSHLRGVLTF